MAIESVQNLKEETIEKLQDLIRANIDSYKGFKQASEKVENEHLKDLFCTLATERSEQATQLQKYVELNHEDAEDDGSYAAAGHRAWVSLRAAISDGDNYAMLAEAERGEDYIKGLYEKVLVDIAGNALSDVLHQQYSQVKATHDRIRDLRDSLKDNE
ncbi:Histidine kinase [Planctomycetales bacterium 10988]|nr:Histidine kinase [Planctomycetales bacterium 10988]